MSARQCFALCIDCWEMHYGITDSNGVYTRDSASSNHADHAVHVFGTPADYPPPIANVLTALHSGLPVSDGRMELFSLACAINAVQPTNGVKAAPPPEIIAKREEVEREAAEKKATASKPTQDALIGDAA